MAMCLIFMGKCSRDNWKVTRKCGKNSCVSYGSAPSSEPPGIAWPLHASPTVLTAGRFFHDDRGFTHRYGQAGHHALHLYLYPGRIRLGPHTWAFEADDLTLTPLGVASSYDLPQGGHHLCIHFRLDHEADSGQQILLPGLLKLGPWRDLAGQKMMNVAQWHALAGGRVGGDQGGQGSVGHISHTTAQAAASAALQELLLWLATRPTAGGEPGTSDADMAKTAAQHRRDAAAERAAAYLEHHLSDPITAADIADAADLSQHTLARAFKRRFGLTIPRYLLIRRVEAARHLLTTTDLPVKSIAARVGLPDPQHFNKQFRRLVGMSPTAARQRSI